MCNLIRNTDHPSQVANMLSTIMKWEAEGTEATQAALSSFLDQQCNGCIDMPSMGRHVLPPHICMPSLARQTLPEYRESRAWSGLFTLCPVLVVGYCVCTVGSGLW